MPAPISLWDGRVAATPGRMPGEQHIAIVVHSLNRGGAQLRLVTLANAFAKAGRRVDLVALRREGDADALLDPRVRIFVLTDRPKPRWKPWSLEGRGKLKRWIRQHRPDVVLAGVNTVHATVIGACGGMRAGRPLQALRVSQHPVRNFPWSRPFRRMREPAERWLRGRLYDQAELVIAVSREVAEALRPRLRHPERCVELPNPVVTPAFTRGLARSAEHSWLGEETPLIVAVGRLTWSKRFDVLLEAFAIVRRSKPVRLIILGEGRSRAELESQIKRLGLADAVRLPGSVAEIAPWLAGADLLVSTSAYEGSPAVLIEALAAGVPVVAARCPGGSEELLVDGRGGTLVPVNDAAATAGAILAELGRQRDPAMLGQLVSRYHVEASAAAYLAALDRAVAERAAIQGAADRRRRAVQQI